ncbi:MAG: hypothetical protein ACLS3C_08915 [Oscillospiraceae bacterium]
MQRQAATLCAQLFPQPSSFAECTINDVLGEHAKTRVNEDEARITLTLPAACESEEAVQAVLSGMMLTIVFSAG